LKKIYIISDATGQSGLHILRAAIVQFEHARAKMMVFHNIDTKSGLKMILEQGRRTRPSSALPLSERDEGLCQCILPEEQVVLS
jgi:regulator of PEP synthase PpsR (kinase-PPPase family)